MQAETMVDNVAQALGAADPASMSEAELDAVFERFESRGTGLEPYFEDWLGGLGKKLKTFANKALTVAKKGLAAFPGIGALIGKLKALVKPMLDRVLKIAIDKLPPALRPAARQLAQRMLGTGQVKDGPNAAAPPTVPDVSDIQQQLDLEMASLLFAEESAREAILAEALYEAEQGDGSPIADLHEARARFVDELEQGIDPQEAMENFIPTVMAVVPIARSVIAVIGRKRVVSYLAGFLAKLISKYVPPEGAKQLSQAIVDAGLRMISLEVPSAIQAPQLAPEAIAETVQDTVRRVADLDETTFEHSVLFEAAVTEAFHEAAAENFPPQLLIPELHEATAPGTWVPMPLRGRHKYYKKYTRVFDAQITPQIADSLKTFGDTTIAAFLKDHLGLVAPVRARVHLYQATWGTSFARIAKLESGVAGLGTAARTAAGQFHPLSMAAAGTLLQEPRLGRDAPGHCRSVRHRIAVGQRFYYLEIPGARAAAPMDRAGARISRHRSSEVNVTLDFPKDEFRVFVYLSESDAQTIASKVRKRDMTGVLLAAKRIYEAGVATALGGDVQRHVKILTEAVAQEEVVGTALGRLPEHVRRALAKKLIEWIGTAVADHVQGRSAELLAAIEAPADGMTLIVTLVNPPGAPLIRRLLHGDAKLGDVLGDLGSLFKGDPKVAVRTVSGFRVD
jgi:hypothetical protein